MRPGITLHYQPFSGQETFIGIFDQNLAWRTMNNAYSLDVDVKVNIIKIVSGKTGLIFFEVVIPARTRC